jgi:hypothetical protein
MGFCEHSGTSFRSVLQTPLLTQIPQSGVALGRILKILRSVEDIAQNLVILEKFVVSNGRHSHFGMPEVLNSSPSLTLAIQSTVRAIHTMKPADIHLNFFQDVLFIVNVQHNCYDMKCTPSGRRFRQQERMDSKIEEHYIEHNDDHHFLLNTHALHNAAILRKMLPRHLTAPVSFITNRRERHDALAAALRETQDVKRARDKANREARKATRSSKEQPDESRAALNSKPSESGGQL